MIHSRRLSPWLALALSISLHSANAAADEPATPPAANAPNDEFTDGWRRTLPVSGPNDDGEADRCTVWIEDGWLQADRRTANGELEWHIVLAQATGDNDSIEITADPMFGMFRLSYRDGRYFIRDEFGNFRCLRQRKPSEGWPTLFPTKSDNQGQIAANAGQGLFLVDRVTDGWCMVATGPAKEAYDCLVRLSHQRLLPPGAGRHVKGTPAPIVQTHHGDMTLLDDGELLVAQRIQQRDALRGLAKLVIRDKLVGALAPDLSASAWINTEKDAWDELSGKVMLLDFWSLTQPASVSELSTVQSLAQKMTDKGLSDKGLMVLAIHPRPGSELLNRMLPARDIALPIMVDDGQTAAKYGVDRLPFYVLVGRDGTISWTGQLPPSRSQIEKLFDPKSDSK